MHWIITALCLVACVTPRPATSPDETARDQVLGTSIAYHSSTLDEDREYRVSLPPSYARSATRRYPVVYVLDAESHFTHVAVNAAYLANQGQIPELIVVGITSTNRVRDFTQTDWPQQWVGGGQAERFRQFLASEIIPLVEKTYRTDGFRILIGHSAAGQFGLYCLTVSPQLFQAILVIGTSLDWDDHLPIRSLEEAIPKRRDVRNFVYFASADDSGSVLDDDRALAALLERARRNGIRAVYHPFPDESHGSSALIGMIDGLRHVFAGYVVPEEVSARGLAVVEAYYAELSKTLGWNTPVPDQVVSTLAFDALGAGKTDEAFALLQRALRSDPSSPEAYDNLAEAYQRTGNLPAALRAAQKARRLAAQFDPSHLAHYDRNITRIQKKQAAGTK
jgi:uncharacterized protein